MLTKIRKIPDLDEEVAPEVGDKYVHVSVMLPCGSQMMHGTVKAHKKYCCGNSIGCWSDNPILDTCLYGIKFLDGDEVLLTAYMIVQAMYAKWNVDGNK